MANNIRRIIATVCMWVAVSVVDEIWAEFGWTFPVWSHWQFYVAATLFAIAASIFEACDKEG